MKYISGVITFLFLAGCHLNPPKLTDVEGVEKTPINHDFHIQDVTETR